ncbi:hypothetical protein COP2_007818 [Malus domestica]
MVASRRFYCSKPLKNGGSRAWAVIPFADSRGDLVCVLSVSLQTPTSVAAVISPSREQTFAKSGLSLPAYNLLVLTWEAAVGNKVKRKRKRKRCFYKWYILAFINRSWLLSKVERNSITKWKLDLWQRKDRDRKVRWKRKSREQKQGINTLPE